MPGIHFIQVDSSAFARPSARATPAPDPGQPDATGPATTSPSQNPSPTVTSPSGPPTRQYPPIWRAFGAPRTGPSFAHTGTLWTAARSLTGWSCRRLCHCGLAAVPGRTRIGAPTLAVYGSVGLDRLSALRAEKRLALGPGPQESVDDERVAQEGVDHIRKHARAGPCRPAPRPSRLRPAVRSHGRATR